MGLDTNYHEAAVLILGLIIACSIIWASAPYASDSPTGFSVAASSASCCDSCTCSGQELCSSCGRCIWAQECSILSGSLNPEGAELILPATVPHDSDFTLNAVFEPDADGTLLLRLSLPNGFEAISANPRLAKLTAGQITVIPFRLHVKRYVAKGEHEIGFEASGTDFKPLSTATAKVRVWWEE